MGLGDTSGEPSRHQRQARGYRQAWLEEAQMLIPLSTA